jgi:hypothetical protein
MRLGLISVIVLVVLGLLSPSALLGQKAVDRGSLNVRQKVENEVLNLQRNMERAKKNGDLFRLLKKTEAEVARVRKKESRQAEADEIYMDQLAAVLSEIPRDGRFKKENCFDYRTTLISNFEPKAMSEVKNPALKSGLEILTELCRQAR